MLESSVVNKVTYLESFDQLGNIIYDLTHALNMEGSDVSYIWSCIEKRIGLNNYIGKTCDDFKTFEERSCCVFYNDLSKIVKEIYKCIGTPLKEWPNRVLHSCGYKIATYKVGDVIRLSLYQDSELFITLDM